jgi:hypothetical protein
LSLQALACPEHPEVWEAEWIEGRGKSEDLDSAQRKPGLGPGEMSTILLGELAASAVLLDDCGVENDLGAC